VEAKQSEHPHRLFVSMRVKLLVSLTLLFSIVFAAAFFWFSQLATQIALRRIEEDLVNTLQAAAAGVNGDELVALVQEGEPNAEGFSDDPRYIRQMDWLQQVHDIEPRAWPYTYVAGDEPNEIIYVADLWARYDTSKAAHFLESYVSRKGLLTAGLERLTRHTANQTGGYTDEWGSWISAYAPISDSAGNHVGGMGIDFEASYVAEVQQAIRNSVLVVFIAAYIVLFLLVYLLSGAFTRPVTSLTKVAERIGEGDYEQDFSGLIRDRLPDEVDTLAQVFSIMVDKVRQREQSLRRQVEELQIMIDESKRDSQVREIVESDFFQDLQAKARSMRKRAQQPPAERKQEEGEP